MVIEGRGTENSEMEPACAVSYSCLNKPFHYHKEFFEVSSTNKDDVSPISCFLGRPWLILMLINDKQVSDSFCFVLCSFVYLNPFLSQ